MMLNKIVLLTFSLLLFTSCKHSPPQYPTEHKNQGFIEQSKIAAKNRLAYEGKLIQDYINSSSKDFFKADGGMYISRLPIDSTYKPKDKDTLTYAYDVRTLNDSIIYHKDSIGLQKHVLGQTSITRGLEYALKRMSKGQSATAIVPSSLAYGISGDNKAIQGDQPILLNIELLNINDE